jgi:hypothetical protein
MGMTGGVVAADVAGNAVTVTGVADGAKMAVGVTRVGVTMVGVTGESVAVEVASSGACAVAGSFKI